MLTRIAGGLCLRDRPDITVLVDWAGRETSTYFLVTVFTRIARVLCLRKYQQFFAYENSRNSMHTRIARILCLQNSNRAIITIGASFMFTRIARGLCL